MSNQPRSPQSDSGLSSVRQYFRAWMRQRGVLLQLLSIALLAFIVQQDGVIRLVATLAVTIPLVAALAVWKWRRQGPKMFE